VKVNDPHGGQSVILHGSSIASARYAFILLHGRGASAEDMISLGRKLADGHTALIAPQAAQHTWYPQSFLAPLEENEPWLSSALGKVAMCVEQCVGAGLHREQLAIIGFSQGACLATEFVARNPDRYGALIAFTGALIGPAGMAQKYSGSLNRTPVLLSSGDPDAHVPWERVEQTASILRQMGATVQVIRNAGRPHTILPTEIRAANELLAASSLSD
jgi:phospholipase/carboxylesterase